MEQERGRGEDGLREGEGKEVNREEEAEDAVKGLVRGKGANEQREENKVMQDKMG